MLIIGLGHQKRTGKDTVGAILFDHFSAKYPNKVVKKINFGDKLKEITKQLYPELNEYSNDFLEANKDMCLVKLHVQIVSYRFLLKHVAKVMRAVDPAFFVKALKSSARGVDVLIICDVRYPNEFSFISDNNGFNFKVFNPRCVEPLDEVEAQLSKGYDWDGVISNVGTLEELNVEVLRVVKQFDTEFSSMAACTNTF